MWDRQKLKLDEETRWQVAGEVVEELRRDRCALSVGLIEKLDQGQEPKSASSDAGS